MTRRERCDTCAFAPDSAANANNPLTLVKAQLCVRLSEPFYCHANLVDGKIPEGQEMLCIGWADMVGAYLKRGFYDHQSAMEKAVLQACMTSVLKLEDLLLAGASEDDVDRFDMVKEVVATLESMS